MSAAALFLVAVFLAGAAAVRWVFRLAPPLSEFPAVTLAATALAGVGAAGELGWVAVPRLVAWLALVLAPLFVFAPLACLALVRAGRWRLALGVKRILYRSEMGRAAVGRLLAQAALNEGDAEGALALAPSHDALLLAQARLLEGDWEGVLASWPADGARATASGSSTASGRAASPQAVGAAQPDNLALGSAARVEALLELGRFEQAAYEVRQLRSRFETGPKGPIAYRALIMSEARLLADQGDINAVRRLLDQPLVGARPANLYAILGRAAARSGNHELAVKAYSEAYAAAAGRLRERHRASLAALGAPAPAALAPVGAAGATRLTLILAALLAAAYLAQVLADRLLAGVRIRGQLFDVSTLVAAYVQGLPGVPAAGAWWRYLSYAFLHGNLVHIAFNLWVLFDLGRLYERRRGWGDLLAAFTAGTAAGALLTGVFQAGQPLVLVGASGGILGLAGALLADALPGRATADRTLMRSLLQWMGIIILFSLAVPGVSLWGHVGGLLGGFAFGLLRSTLPPGGVVSRVAGAAAGLLLAAALLTGLLTIIPSLP